MVWLDLGSAQQRDAFQEVLVQKNYPLERISFVPDLVVDCGANVGFFTSKVAVCYPQAEIIAFEAQNENYAFLAKQPALQMPNVQLIHAAVSNRNGVGLFIGEGVGGRLDSNYTVTEARNVRVTDLGEWWSRKRRPRVLWKIDVEGHENILIPHLSGSWYGPCAVFLETHASEGGDKKIMDVLKKEGFMISLLNEHRLCGDERVFREYLCLLA